MKNKKVIVIAVLIIALGAAAYFFFLKPGQEETKSDVLYEYSPGEYFVTNVKDSHKLFKATVVLMVSDEKIVGELGKNESGIRDTILFLMRELTEADITAPDIQERLRTDITDTLNAKLGIDNIKTCYFSDFVMQ